MNDVKQAVSRNISALRQAAHMTQLELAEQLNYSDKAISKWERGDATPDIVTLTEIANIFGVTLDYLVTTDHPVKKPVEDSVPKPSYSRPIITVLSVVLVWFVALSAFVVVSLLTDSLIPRYLIFIWALPVSLIVWLCFNAVWFRPRLNYLIVSLLMWSVLAAVHLTVLMLASTTILIYVLGVPGQAAILLWMFMKKKPVKEAPPQEDAQ